MDLQEKPVRVCLQLYPGVRPSVECSGHVHLVCTARIGAVPAEADGPASELGIQRGSADGGRPDRWHISRTSVSASCSTFEGGKARHLGLHFRRDVKKL